MTVVNILQIFIFCVVLIALALPLGHYIALVLSGQKTWADPVLRPVEKTIYKLCMIDEKQSQHWMAYAFSCLAFSMVGLFVTYLVQRLQILLPLNPEHQLAVGPALSFNTAISFTTNTNWQSYSGENTLSYLTQMMGLTVHNFTSAATGIGVFMALTRSFTKQSESTLGNFYVDVTRAILYILLPSAIIVALFLIWQGVPQNFDHYTHAITLEGLKQTIAQGPVASQIAIKQLGTNGGGFFGANSAHPFENPTIVTNFVEMLALVLIPASLVFTFGRVINDHRQARALFITMFILMLVGVFACLWAETHVHLSLIQANIDPSGGNMEGKESRLGIVNSALWATLTTDSSNGSVNAGLDSFTPMGGMVPLINMMLSEVVFGGVGSGMHGMIIFVIIAVFIAGLMVGRTPEYLGKKIEAKEVKLAVLCILLFPLTILGFSAIAVLLPGSLSSISNQGPHGLTEILYAYTSTVANNGSAFSGLSTNTFWYNLTLGIAMLIGRFLVIIPTLAIAGSLVAKKTVPASAGTFPTHGNIFIIFLLSVIVVIGGLTFFPVLALGPIIEHFLFNLGSLF